MMIKHNTPGSLDLDVQIAITNNSLWMFMPIEMDDFGAQSSLTIFAPKLASLMQRYLLFSKMK